MITKGTPAVCINGGGDCNDTAAAVYPTATEKCDNIDQDCNGVTDNGCDDDKDGYCDNGLTVVGTPPICTSGGGDCDDQNSLVRPGKPEICDGADNNCSGATDEGCDDDADQYCDSSMSIIGTPAKCIKGGGDCNDASAAINPGATEVCDSVDNNCAAGTDEVCKDSDGDGYCVGTVSVSTACPKGGSDCNDTNVNVNPGKAETCATEYDDNCDGNNNVVNAAACTNFYTDADNDGFGFGVGTCQCFQSAGKTALVNGDCNDASAVVNPGATEVCDGADNNCVGGLDEGCDADGDLFCNKNMLITSTAGCSKSSKPAAGATKPGDDCDDAAATVNPGTAELCDNLDNNCNAAIDEGCDDDNDNFCDSGMTVSGTVSTCTSGGGDCNDTDAVVKPGAAENCTTAADDNCNGATNEQGGAGCTNFYYDGDNDGYGIANVQCWCAISGNYRATKGGDCNDANAAVYPNTSAEACNNVDDNCNGVTDEGCDDDKDGYCDKSMTYTSSTACPSGGGDCDDNSIFVKPSATELCDDVDNNCNAQVDEACNADGDAYCSKAKVTVGTPAVCPAGGGDCDDTTSAISPVSTETCNSKDDNCNGLTDEAGSTGCVNWYYDGDQDGVGISSFVCSCGATGLYTTKTTGDCDDTCPTCAPGKPELCDAKDNNCNSSVDEGCNADNDGYCNAAMVTVGTPAVCTKGGGDCADTNASINPGKAEACNNVDDNCNGTTDENASDGCPAYANAVVKCVSGTCQLKNCFKDFYNLNGSVSDGCECNGTDVYEPNDTCAAAYVVSTNLKDGQGSSGAKELVTARLVDTTDIDWYAVYAADNGDSGYADCDAFNMRVVFTSNPGGNLRFDVWRGTCPAGGTNSVCCSRTDFNWFTNFKSGTSVGGNWSGYGECPCQTGNRFDQSNAGWNIPPGYPGGGGPYCMNYNSGYVCVPTGFYFTQCQDDSAWFYVKVYKAAGSPNCANYSLEFTNGIYGQPGTGAGKAGY
ncbi:MAG: putative metal-binding motif-containing protein [Deltaproteobacteria bacterium]|nr:putative metal-binding motif-containing protein [Deltaproteobacteria bacterium]